jgi:hypothetical protein
LIWRRKAAYTAAAAAAAVVAMVQEYVQYLRPAVNCRAFILRTKAAAAAAAVVDLMRVCPVLEA